jgi:hypothetical protein
VTWPWILLFVVACTTLMAIYIYFIEVRQPMVDDPAEDAPGLPQPDTDEPPVEVPHDDRRVAA